MTYEIALQRLTALCASAEHCEYEMTEKMRKWEVDESDRQRIVEYLRDAKFVDDERYARGLIEKSVSKYWRTRIEQDLRRRGIDRELTERLLDEAFAEPSSAAFDALCKRQKTRALSDPKEKNRAYAYLMRRGFGHDEISAAIERFEMMTGEDFSE